MLGRIDPLSGSHAQGHAVVNPDTQRTDRTGRSKL